MSELGAFLAKNLGAVVVFDLAAIAVVVFCILKEEQLKTYEDRIIRLIRHYVRRARISLKARLIDIARRVFIKVYGTYRRRRIAKLRRLAKDLDFAIRVRDSR